MDDDETSRRVLGSVQLVSVFFRCPFTRPLNILNDELPQGRCQAGLGILKYRNRLFHAKLLRHFLFVDKHDLGFIILLFCNVSRLGSWFPWPWRKLKWPNFDIRLFHRHFKKHARRLLEIRVLFHCWLVNIFPEFWTEWLQGQHPKIQEIYHRLTSSYRLEFGDTDTGTREYCILNLFDVINRVIIYLKYYK